ncbi:MAG TPA: hypothetical protein VMF05_06000 [Stellaceae bacterium]|nr:hypothetical protein [Stellaceae bacterium]
MAGELAKAGKLRGCRAIDGVLRVCAEIWDRVAVQKLSERVYRGLALIGVLSGNELTIERAALVDHPGALAKGHGAVAASLYLDEVFKMAVPNRPNGAANAPDNPFSRIEVGTNSIEENERAILLIKYALSPAAGRIEAAHPVDFCKWLNAKARAGQ